MTVAKRGVGPLLRRMGHDVLAHDITSWAAQSAYYCLFSLFPLILFAAPLLSLVGDRQRTVGLLLHQAALSVPPDVYKLLSAVIAQVVYAPGATAVMSAGAILTVWSASNVFSAVRGALNHALGVEESRPWWKYTLIALAFVLLAPAFVLLATIVLLDGEGVVHTIATHVGLDRTTQMVWTIVQFPLAIAFIVVLAWALYYFLPDGHLSFRDALRSAVTGTALWLVVTIAFRIYVQHFDNYDKVYGTIGGVIVLLTWMYLSMFALLAAGTLPGALRHVREAAARPSEPVMATVEPTERRRFPRGKRARSFR